MADEFERFLQSSLAPAERLPDRAFVEGVQARITLEDRLAEDRRALVSSLTAQLLALIGVAAGVAVVVRAGPIANWFAQSPALGLAALLVAFAFVVAMVSGSSERQEARLVS
jgi:hypothetical protein